MIVKLAELDQIAITDLNGRWQEPSKARTDPYPNMLRRESWLVRDTLTGRYLGVSGQWVRDPVDAWTCMWLANAILYLRHRFGDERCRELELELVAFYCDLKTFPKGWFAADG